MVDTTTTRVTTFLDYHSSPVQSFVQAAIGDAREPEELARRLYYAVRDGIDYDVYGTDLSEDGLRASSIVRAGRGFCVHKSVLYSAACRAVGIPSRIAVGLVRNHLTSPQLRDVVGGDTFVHWLASIQLGGRWVRTTPVFNLLLCRLYRIRPLEFDANSDSDAHPFDLEGRHRMEFLTHFGDYDDVAYDELMDLMAAHHPKMLSEDRVVPGEGTVGQQAPTSRGPAPTGPLPCTP